jgi:hypothetical protein
MKKYLKVGLLSLAVLLILLFGAKYYVKYRLDDLMKSRISQQLGPEFSFNYSSSNLNLLRSGFQIRNLSISRSHADSLRWSFSADKIKLSGFKVFNFLFDEILATDSIIVDAPDLKVFQLKSGNSNRIEQDEKLDQESLDELKFKIKHIGIRNASLKYDPPGPEIMESGMNILVRDVSFQGYILEMVDSLDRLRIEFLNLSYTTPDSVYTVSTDLLRISKSKNFTSFNKLKLKSNLSPTEYDRLMHWKKPLFDAEIEKLEMARPELSPDSIWVLSWLRVSKPNITISKDDRFPLPDRRTDLPQTALKHIGAKFRIDSVKIDSAKVELINVLSANRESEILITEINGVLSSVQNYNDEQPAFNLDAQARLMDKVPLQTSITYSYGDKNPFYGSGHLEDTKLEFMDSFLQKHLGIKVTEGQLDQLSFNVEGNEDGIGGTVDFRYENLQIHLVNKETGKDKELLNFLSDAAGGLVFWKNNPTKEKLRTGEFYVERDVRKGFISQWVDGIMQGVLVTVSKVDPMKIKSMGHKEKHKKHEKNHHNKEKHHKKNKK